MGYRHIDEWLRNASPEEKAAYRRAYKQAYDREYRRVRRTDPVYRAYKQEYDRLYCADPVIRAYRREYNRVRQQELRKLQRGAFLVDSTSAAEGYPPTTIEMIGHSGLRLSVSTSVPTASGARASTSDVEIAGEFGRPPCFHL